MLRLALLQLKTSPVKHENYERVTRLLERTIKQHGKPDMVMLPECFNSPYSVQLFRKYCEEIPQGETTQFLSQLAKKNDIILVGGSYPEKEGELIFNTSVVFDSQGSIIARHRKTHLFDVDIPGKISFQESRVLSSGSHNTVFPTKQGNVGLGICYDLRFPEVAHIATRPPYNSYMMMYPGAFNLMSGPMHWEALARARAIDNQCYIALCSPARDMDAKYKAYGHSLVVDPLGKVLKEAGEDEEALVVEIDTKLVDKVRENMPTREQRRFDLYGDISTGAVVRGK
jgi:predicted amidohydrolase